MARVGARVWMAPETLRLLQEQALPKGDVLTVAKVAGIMAAKRTSELIPLCHPIALTQVDLTFTVVEDQARIDIECVTRTEDRTGVEMEALIGASVAATTIYDMCKAVDRGMVIGDHPPAGEDRRQGGLRPSRRTGRSADGRTIAASARLP